MHSKIHVAGETYFGVIVGTFAWVMLTIVFSVYTKESGAFSGWQAQAPWFIWVGTWLGSILFMRTVALLVTSIYAAEDEKLRR